MTVDQPKSDRIITLIESITDQSSGQPVTIGWMTAEVAGKIIETMEGCRTLFEMAGMQQGMTAEQAKEMATTQWVLLAFQLGMQVAESDASANAMRDLFGDWDPMPGDPEVMGPLDMDKMRDETKENEMRCKHCGEVVRRDEDGNLFEAAGDDMLDYICGSHPADDTTHALDE